MKTVEFRKLVNSIHEEKGKNSLYAFLRKAGIRYEVETVEFGLDSKSNRIAKAEYLQARTPVNVARFHRYSIGFKARSGYHYNRIYAIQLTFNRYDVSKFIE